MPAVIAALVWQWTPFMMLILLAGLQSQPGDVLEAAKIDRADGLADLPLHHAAAPAPVHRAVGPARLDLRAADLRRDLHDHPGRARSATTNLPYEIYLTMFRKYEYGEAAAAGVVVVIGTIIVATFALRTISSLFTEETSR